MEYHCLKILKHNPKFCTFSIFVIFDTMSYLPEYKIAPIHNPQFAGKYLSGTSLTWCMVR